WALTRTYSCFNLGSLSGTPINITMLSHAGTAHVGLVHDRAAVTDGAALARHLAHGLALIREAG
ncbi:MAG: WS/DGAT domain-containing protein, partial [Acidimicrobiales bacterium]